MLSPRRIRPLTADQLVDRVRREFAALPGLRLTEDQIRRVWQIDPDTSTFVLGRLVQDQFLVVTGHGEYARAGVRRPTDAATREVLQSRPAAVRVR